MPVDNGLTETVQPQVFQGVGPQNAAPVLHSIPVQALATAAQQRRENMPRPFHMRVYRPYSLAGVGIRAWVRWRQIPNLEALTLHVAGCPAVSGAFAAAEVTVLVDSGSVSTAMTENRVEALWGQPGVVNTALTETLIGYAMRVRWRRWAWSEKSRCTIVSALLEDQNFMGTISVNYDVYRAPWGKGSCYYRAENAERELHHRHHAAAEGPCTGAAYEHRARAVGQPNPGDFLPAAMAITTFAPGVHAPSDVDSNVTRLIDP